jgi:hypothetical protein
MMCRHFRGRRSCPHPTPLLTFSSPFPSFPFPLHFVIGMQLEVERRRAVGQADRIGQPPGLRSELNDMLLSFGIDDVAAQTEPAS